MLTHAQYNDLWTLPAPIGFGQPLAAIPPYLEYLKREIYFQDYLDLFLPMGVPTFARIVLPGGGWGVMVAGTPLAGLGIPPVLLVHGCVPVDYDYPWTYKELLQKRCIKYIMVGEAPPPEIKGTYFYNHHHGGNTAWLNAPVAAFGIAPALPKRDKLLELANNSYILIDLFPFVLPLGIRNHLNAHGVSQYFFINYLCASQLAILVDNKLLCNEPILAFSGPPTIHHFLAHQLAIGAITIPAPITCRSVPNFFIPPAAPIPPALPPTNILWPVGSLLSGVYANPGLISVPFYRCCVYMVGGLWGPHELFIRNAFL